MRRGLASTLALALAATAGRIAVPVAIQQSIDHGLTAPGGPDAGAVAIRVGLAGGLLIASVTCAYLMSARMFQASEGALADIRGRTFRHIHDLSVLRQQAEPRGSLVSRVTGDVDELSQFLQSHGMLVVINAAQILVATALMLVYSWPLTLVVYAAFAPLVVAIRVLRRRLAAAYQLVRERVAVMLTVIAESVVGATVIRAYAVRRHSAQRLDATISATRDGYTVALRRTVYGYAAAEISAGLASIGVLAVGVWLGVAQHLTVGRLTAFLFLVALFVGPMQVATEVLNELHGAAAGWRRVLDVLDQRCDVDDPGERGRELPAGPLGVRIDRVGFAYPGGPEVLTGIDLTIAPLAQVAVVGETGSGKTTLARLLTRLVDADRGQILLSGVPLREVSLAELRRRVLLVPQECFLFEGTVADNIRFTRPDLTDDDVWQVLDGLGLRDWVARLPAGLATPVGERGEALSAGERQLVALARADVADPDLLVLDEATSAVDPATEMRIASAVDTLRRGRTTLTIAHRLSTARGADEVVVVDAGRIVQRGRHDALVQDPDSVYGRLYAAWLARVAG
jgi:ABC-type multidrug transport system fused ATPase/permease subunit